MKVLFMGNHNVGIEAIKGIQETACLVGIVAHPLDKEEGVVYESVFKYAYSIGVEVIRGKGTDEHVKKFIFEKKPDIILLADYKFLIPKEIIQYPPNGCINLHPSLLPKYRGRAPLNWAIINGEHSVGLTSHLIDEGVDTGDILLQKPVDISEKDYVGDILNKLYPLYRDVAKQTLCLLQKGVKNAQKQPIGNYKTYPRRTPEDGCIDWNEPLVSIHNHIRAVSKPYPGAFSLLNNEKVIFWRAEKEILSPSYASLLNGTILDSSANSFRVKCEDGILKVTEWEGGKIEIGSQFNSLDNVKNISLYTKRIKKYGVDVKSLNWGSEESQKLRFRILSEVGPLQSHSILDVGCGLGDFYAWLQTKKIECDYTGIDITPKMIITAQKRFPSIPFSVQDVLKQPPNKHDFILMSGIFTYQNIHFFQEMITALFECADKAIAFNVLSSLAEEKEEGEFYADPTETLAFCQSLTPWVVLRHDYHPRDFTIYIYKKRNI